MLVGTGIYCCRLDFVVQVGSVLWVRNLYLGLVALPLLRELTHIREDVTASASASVLINGRRLGAPHLCTSVFIRCANQQ